MRSKINSLHTNPNYKASKHFFKSYGFGYIPMGINDEYDQAHAWQRAQRNLYEQGYHLINSEFQDMVEELETLGMHVTAVEPWWNDWYLMLYRVVTTVQREDGFIHIKSTEPSSEEKKWYHSQESGFRDGRLHADKVEILKRLGFRFMFKSASDIAFEAKCEELKEFVSKHGHALVTPKTKGYERLGRWVARVRYYRRHREDHPRALSDERINMCNQAGMVWDARKKQ